MPRTLATWTLFTKDDPSPDFVLEVFRHPDTGSAHARVVDARGTTDEVMCTADVQATAGGLRVTGVDADHCLDGAQDVRAEAGIFCRTDDMVVAYDDTTPWGSRGPTDYVRDTTGRLFGGTRTKTSVAISQAQFAPGDADTVYLPATTCSPTSPTGAPPRDWVAGPASRPPRRSPRRRSRPPIGCSWPAPTRSSKLSTAAR